MTTSPLLSHRLFVSALTQDPHERTVDPQGLDRALDQDQVLAVQLELMPERDLNPQWHQGQSIVSAGSDV